MQSKEKAMIFRPVDKLPNRFSFITALFLLTASCSGQGLAGGTQKAGAGPLYDEAENRYIVQMADPPLAAYEGGITGLDPTSPGVTGKKLDLQSTEARAYLEYLSRKKSLFKKRAELLLGREVVFDDSFEITLNAVVMTMTRAEAAEISAMPEVKSVEPDRELKLHPKTEGNLQLPPD